MAYTRLDTKYKDGAIWDGAAVSHIDDALEELLKDVTINELIASESDYSIAGFYRPAGTSSTNSSYKCTDYIDIEGFTDIVIHCKPASTSVAPVVWFDSAKNYISGITAESIDEQDIAVVVPTDASYAIFSSLASGVTCSVSGTKLLSGEETLTEEVITNSSDYSITGFIRPAGTEGTATGYVRTDYITISDYISIKVNCFPYTASVSPVTWYDADKNVLYGETATGDDLVMDLEFEYTVPSQAVYAIFSSSSKASLLKVVGTKILDFDARIKECLIDLDMDETGDTAFNFIVEKDSMIQRVNAEEILASAGGGGDSSTIDITTTLATDLDYTITGFCRPAGSFGTASGYIRTDYIEVEGYDTITVHCKPNTASVSPCVWFNASKTYISGETASSTSESDFAYEVPSGAVYAIFSSATLDGKKAIGAKSASVSEVVSEMKEQLDKTSTAQCKCYISPNGSDENDGLTTDTPILTITQASKLMDANGELVFMEGDYENLGYDLSLFSKVSTIGNVRLIYYTQKFTEATLVDGYTRVYSTPYASTYSYYLWQMDIPDTNTAISAEERHPLQRNRAYRLEHTRIYPVTKFDTTSTDLTGYLATMESTTDKWMYYMDGTNCYFTAPNTDFATYPIIRPSSVLLKASEQRNVNISGLKIYFASILTTNLTGTLNNLTVGYHTQSGAIRWDNTFNLILNNCEVAAGTNDGINGHTAGDITCYSCWGHDFADDGESDHETCHIIQYGGLYEYNGNGCTPASGASGEYINTIVRNNQSWDWVTDVGGTGFSAQGESALISCIGCYTENCKIGFRQTGTNSSGTFINCVSKNDNTAFGAGTQINCVTLTE